MCAQRRGREVTRYVRCRCQHWPTRVRSVHCPKHGDCECQRVEENEPHSPFCRLHPLNIDLRRRDCVCGVYTVHPDCPQHGHPGPAYGVPYPGRRPMPEGISEKLRNVVLAVLGEELCQRSAVDVAVEEGGQATINIAVHVDGYAKTESVTVTFKKGE